MLCFPSLADWNASDLVGLSQQIVRQPIMRIDEGFPVSRRDSFRVPLAWRLPRDAQLLADGLPADPLNDLTWGPDVLHARQDGELNSRWQENVSRLQTVNLCKVFPLLCNNGI